VRSVRRLVAVLALIGGGLAIAPAAHASLPTQTVTVSFTATGVSPSPYWSWFTTQRGDGATAAVTVHVSSAQGGSVKVATWNCSMHSRTSNTVTLGAGDTGSLSKPAGPFCLAVSGVGTDYATGTLTFREYS
jgi:hypothetical protein